MPSQTGVEHVQMCEQVGGADAGRGTHEPVVSVVVPVYNVASLVGRCVESLVGQTYQNLEVILVNDGSTDGSLEVCQDLASRHPRVTLVSQENQGVSVARNRGLEHARGQWVCFVDGDDWLLPDAIQSCMDQDLEGADILVTDYTVATESGRTWQEAFLKVGERDFCSLKDRLDLVKSCYVHTSLSSDHAITMIGVPWAKLYRTAFLKEHGLTFDPALRKMQDAVFNSYAFYQAGCIRYRKVATYAYWQNDQSVTHRANPRYPLVTGAVLSALRNFIQAYRLQEDLDPVYDAKAFSFAFESIKFVYLLDKGGTSLRDRLAGTRYLMRKVSYSGQGGTGAPTYLGKVYTLAFRLSRAHLYALVYGLAVAYLAQKNRQYR